jgi:RNA polymerase sigma factor (sigma-70 family)
MNRITDAETIDSPPRTSDGDLLRRFLGERDDRAFAELVTRHGSMVYGVCLRRLGQCQDAEDAFQAVFLALATHAEKLVDGVTVGPWLYTVVRQVSTKALRSRRRRRWVFWGSMPEPATKPPVEVDVDLDAALATLNEQERSAIILCHLEGMSRSEAAKALGCPEGTLSTRLSRALEKLRRKLGKPPLAILAAATMVMLPEALPAAAAGLVRHLRDGTLDDWASPQTLDLYRKAVPMRLLDRFGPAIGAVVAAVLILVGAAFGWQIITAQQPNGAIQPPQAAAQPAKKSFAAAVQELQGNDDPASGKKTSFVQFRISPPRMKDAKPPWTIQVVESFAGEKVENTISAWPAIEPFLRQIATDKRSIDVDLTPSAVSRLEANQIVNICKRVGFEMIDYRGPELFIGGEGDRWESDGSSNPVAFRASLINAESDLPDWTNGWAVKEGKIHRYSDLAKEGGASMAVDLAQGEFGPAFEKARENRNQVDEKKEALAPTDLGKRLGGLQQSLRSTAPSVQMVRSGTTDELCVLTQLFGVGYVQSKTTSVEAFKALLTRTAKAKGGGRFDVRVGQPDVVQSNAASSSSNPLLVNTMLNALKKGGATEIHYWGQPLFSGYGEEAIGKVFPKFQSSTVRLILQPQSLDGDLPDESNGWTVIDSDKWQVIKASDRDRVLQLQKTKDAPRHDEEVARLAKLPLDEFERELAKKPSQLRNRWRKSVEEAKAKLK